MGRLTACQSNVPVTKNLRQMIAQRDHLRDPRVNLRELRLRDRADFAAWRVSRIALPEKSSDVFDRKPDRERTPQNRNAPNDIIGIRAIAVG